MTLVIQGRVVLDCFVVKGDQVLGRPVSDLLSHLLLELFDCQKDRVDLHGFDGLFVNLTLQDHSLLFVLLLDRNVVLLKVLDNHGDAVV